MTERTPALASRLPQVGTTIFSVMSALAAEHGAVNLGQGFPDFDCDPKLVDGVTTAMQQGHNQYPPMPGVMALRQAHHRKKVAAIPVCRSCAGHALDPTDFVSVDQLSQRLRNYQGGQLSPRSGLS